MLQEMDGYNSQPKKNIAVLASGNGSNLSAIIDAVNLGTIKNANISLVVSNKKEAYALKRAKDAGISSIYVPRSQFCSDEDYDLYLISLLIEHRIELVVLAGYLKIITWPFLKAFKDRILNIHPSLLPDFGGRGMYGMKVHEAVIKSKSLKSGCTVHLVTEEIDGGTILAQEEVDISNEDTPETLAAKVLKKEHKLYPQAISNFVSSMSHESRFIK